MQNELRDENSLRFPFITFFEQLIVPMEVLPKTNWILRVRRHSHTHSCSLHFTSYLLGSKVGANFLPAVCQKPQGGENARESIHFSSPICIIKNHFSSWQWLKSERKGKKMIFLLFCLVGDSRVIGKGKKFKFAILFRKTFYSCWSCEYFVILLTR